MAELDTSRAPLGVLVAQELINAVVPIGDLAERHYLELKSTLDLSTKRDKEKIAKFILGAANRMPDVASTAFEGYAVMLIGVGPEGVVGIPPVEMMEISRVIQQYIGAAGPRWDVLWVPVHGSANQVLVVLVDPPKPGQGPFPCRSSGESLTDGRIYVRADGETREAKAEEVDLLVRRGNSPLRPAVDFAVEVIGEVAPFSVDDEVTIGEYLGTARASLESALQRDRERRTAVPPAASGLAAQQRPLTGWSAFAGATSQPEDRTEEEYLESISTWESEFRQAWTGALLQLAAAHIRPSVVRVTNRTTTFFHDVQLRLHLAGEIFALEYEDPKHAFRLPQFDLPSPPRRWGPWERPILPNLGRLPYVPSIGPFTSPSITFKNGGSVTLELEVGELRPRGVFESEGDEIVLVVADPSLSSIEGTWELTARDHNEVYSGETIVEVAPRHDCTTAARGVLGLVDGTSGR